MDDFANLRLPPESLTIRHDPSLLDFETTDDIRPIDEIIGQDRALKALKLGLEIEGKGFNVYVSGFAGSGRTTTIKKVLEDMEGRQGVPDDLCYVNNFKDPKRPRLLRVKPGSGRKLARSMDYFLNYLKKQIPQILESEEYGNEVRSLKTGFEEQNTSLIRTLEERVREAGFAVANVAMGPVTQTRILPLINDNPVPLEKLAQEVSEGNMEADDFQRIKEQHDTFTTDLEKVAKEAKKVARTYQQKFSDLLRSTIEPAAREGVETYLSEYEERDLKEYIEELVSDILDTVEELELGKSADETARAKPLDDPLRRYRVKVLVDNAGLKKAPVVVENCPNFRNLFGTIERTDPRQGEPPPDFLDIVPGSMLQANGGYLVINAHDMMNERGVWVNLKRALRTQRLEIQSYEPGSPPHHTSLKPEPIKLNIRVIMAGESYLYRLLYLEDEDFSQIFKIKADFDSTITRTEDNINRYARFVAKIVKEHNLLPFNRGAVGAVLDAAVRLAEHQEKLSTKFSSLTDIIVEAGHWARKEQAGCVTREHVEKTMKERRYRSNLLEEKVQEMIREQTILIDVMGLAVGQVNGLSLLDFLDYDFSRPAKITATTSVGKSGIINIEREVELSGHTHDKGVLILTGYLRTKYAQEWPLTLSASVCFEQSYGGVDGDSASSSELYALLSSVGQFPIRQDIAVTGSINQKGEIQPIGGVNEKIEGFYRICESIGLSGQQAVIIPVQNVKNLVLDEDVIEAVRKDLFRIYPIRTVDEGISILSGLEAGTPRPDGTFPSGTVHDKVYARLRSLAEKHREYESYEPDYPEEE
ncbi:Lon protease family protein [Acidobacteriota bacterium]